MMIEPPIDKLILKAPCRYALVIALAKRAREVVSTKDQKFEESHLKAISYAAKEIYDGDVVIKVDNK
ncbi:MAG: DNA-directed RNA polymerase subunit omega [Clostridia bacterium]|nr:DNA-directed RNA polymerase subunit omega [Clostridia bacterium]